jgi:lysophospholipase L1-like esterase
MALRRACILAGLLALAGCNLLKNPDQPSVPTDMVNYAALGASDTIGYGGSAPCLPFVECMTGTGYVQRTAQRLKASGKTVTLVNLGVPGAVLSPDVQTQGNTIGLDILRNLLNDESGYVPKNTTLVTVFIGGNDVNTIGSLIKAGRAGSDVNAYIQGQIQNFGRDLNTMLTRIRADVPNARIVALNLPNMGLIPYSAGRPLDERRTLQQISVGFSAQISALGTKGVLVMDLMCDPNFYNPSIFSSDGFHPNDTGYAYLSDLVYPAATTGTAATPKSSCGFMTGV